MLCLQFDHELRPSDGCEVCSPLAAPVKQDSKEAAGLAFHAIARRQSGLDVETEPEVEAEEAVKTDADTTAGNKVPLDDQPPPGTEYRSKGKKKKKKSDQTDHYALLGLQQERWTATEAQIKLAYRKQALECHPDKAGAAVADEVTKLVIESKFRAVQEAYDILSDPARRREYDSVDDFDDSLPVDCSPADFFKVFAPAFRRNSRWSVTQPVPEVGDDSTSYADADKFYNFWFSFRSWREFPHPDEEETEQAESREERRWIERYNSKLREGGKKEEKRRLKEFVEAAYKRDPRILRQREFERSERDRKKREKQDAARARVEAEQRAAAEVAAATAAKEAAAAEEAAEARKVRQREKKAMQKERQRLRGLCASIGGATDFATDERVETLCFSLPLEGMQALCDQLSAVEPSQRKPLLMEQAGSVETEKAAEAQAKAEAHAAALHSAEAAKRRNDRERAEARARDWEEEEMRMLQKALARYPQGTAKRWEQVAAYVRTRTVEEVLEMVKHGLKAAKFAPNQNGFQITKKRQGNTQIASGATQRAEAFTDVPIIAPSDPASNPTTSASSSASAATNATPPTANGNSASTSSTSTAKNSATTAASSGPPEANGATPPTANGHVKSEKGKKSPRDSGGTGAAAANGPSANGDASAEGWSETQELALVQALKKHGKDLEDRWDRVAKDVPGKSKGQCMKRFKALRSTFRQQQSGSTS
ncbi:hypothetical protein WJX73_010169 [Symbiochloris irregularis]|uniref:DnaJ homolog subfamily C member 2 n=1 Tax=Symbiochloris irregularis TaxID=706552 RepID=A0AAW1NIJ9_9CHLO